MTRGGGALPAIRTRGLAVEAPRERGRVLLGPLDLEVAAGEQVLVVGPSGGGKTTLLRAIAGLATPSAGTLELFGEPVSEGRRLLVPPHRRGIGMLFQGGALWPHMSAARTLRFTARAAGRPATAARVAELLDLVRLPGYERRMPGTLSGGERQRLALARAMASEPRLVLLDEPLGPLDGALRGDLLATLADLSRRLSWTTLHVTHDPAEAREHADRVLRLERGRLTEETS